MIIKQVEEAAIILLLFLVSKKKIRPTKPKTFEIETSIK